MKKFKLFSILTLTFVSFIFYNCSNDGVVEKNAKVLTSQENSNSFRESEFLIVEPDETPEFSNETLELLGFSDFVIDTTKNCTINLGTNIVSLPYDSDLTNYVVPSGKVMIVDAGGWLIAKKNVKPGSGCSSCVDCIGFRCGSAIVSEITELEWSIKKESSEISNSRNQEAYITVDHENHTVNLNFYNVIQWNNLK